MEDIKKILLSDIKLYLHPGRTFIHSRDYHHNGSRSTPIHNPTSRIEEVKNPKVAIGLCFIISL